MENDKEIIFKNIVNSCSKTKQQVWQNKNYIKILLYKLFKTLNKNITPHRISSCKYLIFLNN